MYMTIIFIYLLLGNCLDNQSQNNVEPPFEGVGTKINSNGLGHMTKMADMPIHGRNL